MSDRIRFFVRNDNLCVRHSKLNSDCENLQVACSFLDELTVRSGVIAHWDPKRCPAQDRIVDSPINDSSAPSDEGAGHLLITGSLCFMHSNRLLWVGITLQLATNALSF